MKYCYKCGKTKEASEFHKNKNKKDGLANYCKPCAKIRNREYYLATPERNPQRTNSRKVAVAKAREYVWNYLLDHPCVDDGENDPIVLEFDHVRDSKVAAISNMVKQGLGIETIQAEIDKCEVRCANCHRKVTSKRAGWYAGPVV